MKYIMFEDFAGQPVPVIFPNRIDHMDMREQMPYATVLGAGYVQLRDGMVSCHGGSKAMGKEARSADAEIIREKLENPDD